MIKIYINTVILPYIELYPFKAFLCIVICLLLLLIRYLSRIELSTNHKIYNFYINWLWIFVYFIIYICIFLFLRYRSWGNSVDLKIFFTKLLDIWHISYLFSLILGLLWFIFIIILYKVRKLLTKEIIKRHLFTYYTLGYAYYKKYGLKGGKKPFYLRLIDVHLMSTYSYKWIIYDLDSKYTNLIRIFLDYRWKVAQILFKIFKPMIRILPIAILITLIVYDCYYNKFVINKIFYYMPFYLIYTMWYNVTEFLTNTDGELNRILYERYYLEEDIFFIGTTTEEDEYILKYIRRGFIAYWNEYLYTEEYIEKKEFFSTYAYLIQYNRRYIRDKSNMHELWYKNPNTGECLDIRPGLKDIKELD